MPFFPDTFFGHLIMWPTFIAFLIGMARGGDMQRAAVIMLLYWVAGRWLVSTHDPGSARETIGVIIQLSGFVVSLVWLTSQAGKWIFILFFCHVAVASARIAGGLNHADALVLFDLFRGIQLLLIIIPGAGLGLRTWERPGFSGGARLRSMVGESRPARASADSVGLAKKA